MKDAGPPHDLCILHGEMRSFFVSGVPQSRFGNAYYHVNVDCVRRVWPTLHPQCCLSSPSGVARI